MKIRDERESDRESVHDIVAAEFDTGAEAGFIETIRKRSDRLVSLVAEDEGRIVGHILMSSVPLEEHRCGNLAGLVALAVLPERQGEGIGSALVRAGLDRCRQLGFDGAVALGHPDYYARFGFEPAARFGLRFPYRVPEDAFLALELRPSGLEGKAGTINHLSAAR